MIIGYIWIMILLAKVELLPSIAVDRRRRNELVLNARVVEVNQLAVLVAVLELDKGWPLHRVLWLLKDWAIFSKWFWTWILIWWILCALKQVSVIRVSRHWLKKWPWLMREAGTMPGVSLLIENIIQEAILTLPSLWSSKPIIGLCLCFLILRLQMK